MRTRPPRSDIAHVPTHSGLVADNVSGLGHTLSVRLHVSLLEVVGKLVKVLVVGQQGLGLGTCESRTK